MPSIFSDAKYLTSSVFVSLVLAALRSVLVLRILGPQWVGDWKTAMLLYTLAEAARLGVSRAVGVRVPILQGQGRQQEADQTIASAGTFTVLVGVLLGLAIAAASFFLPDYGLRTAFRYVAVMVALAQPYLLLREVTMARQLFTLRTRELWLACLLDFAAVLVLCSLFQLHGLGVASVVGILIPALYLLRGQRFSLHRSLNVPKIKELIRLGIPYSLTDAAFEVLRRLDVLAVAVLLGSTWVGYYSVSILIMDFAGLLTRHGVAQLVAPHLLREFGRTGSHQKVAVFYEQPARLFSYVLPPLLGTGTIVIAELIRLFLPQYVSGVMAAEITLWSVFFVALQSGISAFLIAAGKLNAALKAFAILIPAGLLAQVAVIKAGGGLTGAAWATMALLALSGAIQFCLARDSCGHSRGEIRGFLFSLHVPFLLALIIKTALDKVIFDDMSATPLQMLVKAVLFLVLYSPVLLFYERRFSMLQIVWEAK